MLSIRSFLALPTSEQTKASISLLQSKLRESEAEVRWESSDKFHITLKFLGNVEPPIIDSLVSQLQVLLKNVSSLKTIYNTIGGFPSVDRPRVIWIGAEQNEFLMKLQENIESVCTELGFDKEDRVFHPHITLGRVKGNRKLSRLTETVKSLTFEPIQALCSEVLLIKSDLKPSGSVYTTLKSFPLQA